MEAQSQSHHAGQAFPTALYDFGDGVLDLSQSHHTDQGFSDGTPPTSTLTTWSRRNPTVQIRAFPTKIVAVRDALSSTSQSHHTDQGFSDEVLNRDRRRGQLDVAIPQYRSGQFRSNRVNVRR
jgi:hypothetical protein